MSRGRRAWLAAGAALLAAAPLARAEPPSPATRTPHHRDAIPRVPSVDERLLEIQRRVQGAVTYPPSARDRGAEGEARVAFEIGADGHAARVRTEQSSGSVVLDRAAERAVREAGPLPALSGRITVPVRFALQSARPGAAD